MVMRNDKTTAGNRNHIIIQRARSAGPVTAGDTLGGIAIGGKYNGSTYSYGWDGGSEMTAWAAENWSATNRGSALSFNTTPNGTALVAERMRIDQNGNVGIGTTNPVNSLQINSDNTSGHGITINGYGTSGNQIALFHVNGSIAAPTNMTTNSNLGQISGSGYWTGKANPYYESTDGSRVKIAFYAAEDWTSSTANGTYMVFTTTPTGSATPAERMRIGSTGNVAVGTTSPSGGLHVSGTDALGIMRLDRYHSSGENGAALIMRKATGTSASPSAVVSGDDVGAWVSRGYGATGFNTGGTVIKGIAAENFTDSAAGQHLTFWTNPIGSVSSSERMRITEAGNVGVGTAAPAAKLDIVHTGAFGNDALHITASGTTKYIFAQYDTTNDRGRVGAYESGVGLKPLYFDSSTALFGGNVGIGTTAPSARLDVGGSLASLTAMSTNVLLHGGNLGTTAADEVSIASFAYGNSGGNQGALGVRAIRTANGNLWTTSAVGIGMDVDNAVRAGGSLWFANGNVGVGTTTPSMKLDINTGGTTNGINVTTGNGQIGLRLGAPGNTYLDFYNSIGAADQKFIRFGSTGADLTIEKVNDAYSVATPLMIVKNSGNVGIGTTSPSQKLDVAGVISSTAGFAGVYLNETDQAVDSRIWRWGSAGGALSLQTLNDAQDTASYAMNFVRSGNNVSSAAIFTGGSSRLHINSSGDVGIGTTSPLQRFEVTGATASTTTIGTLPIVRMSRINTSGIKWGSVAEFSIGTYDTVIGSRTRLDLNLNNGSTIATEMTAMTWQANGNVGVGTTTPSAKLDVAGQIYSTAIVSRSSAAALYVSTLSDTQGPGSVYFTSPSGAIAEMRPAVSGTSGTSWITIDSGSAAVSPRISTQGTSTGLGLGGSSNADHIFINTSGSVGIGATSPTEQLAVCLTAASVDRISVSTLL